MRAAKPCFDLAVRLIGETTASECAQRKQGDLRGGYGPVQDTRGTGVSVSEIEEAEEGEAKMEGE